jgi:hypothetical protein
MTETERTAHVQNIAWLFPVTPVFPVVHLPGSLLCKAVFRRFPSRVIIQRLRFRASRAASGSENLQQEYPQSEPKRTLGLEIQDRLAGTT